MFSIICFTLSVILCIATSLINLNTLRNQKEIDEELEKQNKELEKLLKN
jgi:hypothetical protein